MMKKRMKMILIRQEMRLIREEKMCYSIQKMSMNRFYSTNTDQSIGFLLENLSDVYRDLVDIGLPVISEKEFHSQQQLVLAGFYELSPFQIFSKC